jgi:tetratricopeptide (TPR) repeat protein
MATTTTTVDALTEANNSVLAQRANLSKYALINGLKMLQSQNYSGAEIQFKKAIAFNPDSLDAYNTLANTYLQQNKTKEAIDTFKQVLRLTPSSEEAYKNLGNAYLQAGNYSDAERQFKAQARINPTSTYPYYTLGLLYAQTDRLTEAETQFNKVISLDRKDSHGYYGLGMVYNQMGRHDEAIPLLQQATSLKKDFAEAQYELGNAYAELGLKDKAGEQVDLLKNLGNYQYLTLQNALTQPGILAAFSYNFDMTLGSETPLSKLNTYLETPGATMDFSLIFQFDSEMDMASVQNIFNWSISKAAGGTAGTYNNGITLDADNNVNVASNPKYVSYDQNTLQAVVTFSISQNASGTGVIDPSHLVFKFSGTDVNGKIMDPEKDQYNGFNMGSF